MHGKEVESSSFLCRAVLLYISAFYQIIIHFIWNMLLVHNQYVPMRDHLVLVLVSLTSVSCIARYMQRVVIPINNECLVRGIT